MGKVFGAIGVLVAVVAAAFTVVHYFDSRYEPIGREKTTAAVMKAIQEGVILPWYKKSGQIPDGWVICDGSNETPDLRNRFIMGVAAMTAVGDTGGANGLTGLSTLGHALTVPEMPSHQHTTQNVHEKVGDAKYPVWDNMGNNGPRGAGITQIKGGGAEHRHLIPALDNRPAYVSIIYIMRVK